MFASPLTAALLLGLGSAPASAGNLLLPADAGRGALRPSAPHASPQQTAPASTSTDCDAATYDCAVLRIRRGDFRAAVAGLEQMRARSPRDLKILNLLGIALTGDSRIAEANERFTEALAIAPDFYPARKNLAVNEFNAGRTPRAEQLFRQVLERAPDDEIAHVHLAEIHFARKEPAPAAAHYARAGASLASNPTWTLHYAVCLLDAGDRPRALALLETLPGDPAIRFEAGVALGRAQAYGEAARFFGEARTGYRDPSTAGYNQVLMLVEAGDHERAIQVAQELVGQGLQSGELYNLVSRAYAATDRIQEAYDSLRTAARLEPGQEQHYLDLALLCLDHENFDLGLEILGLGLRHNPQSATLHLYKGVMLVMRGLVEEAETEFERARSLGPEGPVPHVALAMAWMQSGQTSRAVELLRERVAAGSNAAIVPYMFGIALMRSGVDPADPAAAEAIGAFEQAARLDPQLAGPRAELGKILLARGDAARAIEHLEQAVRLDPDNASPAYSLAQAYRKTGETARAQDLLARVSRLNAQGRGDDPDRELRRMVVRIVREGAADTAPRQ
ncbi:MAG TPA: tetratricopeptide repeat protein [Vicinamibacterales bacterium]|nr:tetratricopeptide repeat protein [Vicinamibacterales bacterium]